MFKTIYNIFGYFSHFLYDVIRNLLHDNIGFVQYFVYLGLKVFLMKKIIGTKIVPFKDINKIFRTIRNLFNAFSINSERDI